MVLITPEERKQKIERYGNAYQLLVDALKEFPQEMWQFRASPDEWTVHELIIHITDSESNSYIRCRRGLAEPGSNVLGYNETVWAKKLDYHHQSTDDALDLFRALRQSSYNLIKNQPDSVWSNTIEHSENGTMTLDDWLESYTNHVPDHIEQMRRNFVVWQRLPQR